MRQVSALLAVVLLGLTGLALAAAPEAGPEPIATRQNVFSIPFRIEPARSAATAPVEAQLFVSIDRGESWNLAARAEPKQGRFQYRAPHDGEYWFAIRTLDRSQKLRPDKPLSPEMQVLVDTVAPLIEVTAERGSGGEVQIRWKMVDPHLDPTSLRIDFRGEQDIDWQAVALDPEASLQGKSTGAGETTIWPSDPGQSVVVRAQAVDRAGNPAVSQAEARARSQPDPQAAHPQGSEGPSLTGENGWSAAQGGVRDVSQLEQALPPRGPLPVAPQGRQRDTKNWPADRVLRVPLGRQSSERIAPPERERAPFGGQVAEDLPPPRDRRPQPPRTLALPAAQRERVGPPVEELSADGADDQLPEPGPEGITGVREAASGIAAREATFPLQPTEGGGDTAQQVNSRKFELDYDIESAGPTGVSRVELWETRNGGESWRALAADDDNRSPMLVEVEGEGLYGFTFVISSDTGLSGRPPVPGDPAEVVVAVDLSPPEVNLVSVELGAGREAGELKVFWKADDRLLAARPISLLFSESPEGPWQPISSGLENSGQFVWRIDNRAPDQLYLRVEARDAAGNVGSDQSSEPVQLASVRPSAKIRYVRPVPSASRPKIYQFFR